MQQAKTREWQQAASRRSQLVMPNAGTAECGKGPTVIALRFSWQPRCSSRRPCHSRPPLKHWPNSSSRQHRTAAQTRESRRDTQGSLWRGCGLCTARRAGARTARARDQAARPSRPGKSAFCARARRAALVAPSRLPPRPAKTAACSAAQRALLPTSALQANTHIQRGSEQQQTIEVFATQVREPRAEVAELILQTTDDIVLDEG